MKKFLHVLSLSVVSALVLSLITSTVEPAIVTAATATDNVVVTLNVTADISITDSSNVSMSQALSSSVNTAVGTSTWNVKTNSSAGYTLAVRATNTPAMLHSNLTDTIANDQTGAPATWAVSSGNAEFGYSAAGTDVPTGTWGTYGGGGCSATSTAHSISTSLKYKGLTTSDVTVATRSSTTTPSGVDATVCYAVEQNGFYIPSGTYQATVIATATTL